MDLLEEKRWELVNLSKELKIKDDRIIIPLQFFRIEELQEMTDFMRKRIAANNPPTRVEWEQTMCELLLQAIRAKRASEEQPE